MKPPNGSLKECIDALMDLLNPFSKWDIYKVSVYLSLFLIIKNIVEICELLLKE